jgi:hypothetical protein
VPATDAAVPKVNALLIFVVPAPATALFNVPERFNVPAFVIVPPKLSAVEVKVAPEFIDTACAMLAELVTVPEIVVEPAPVTFLDNVPAFKIKLAAFDTAPPKFDADVVSEPELIVTPCPMLALLITVPAI